MIANSETTQCTPTTGHAVDVIAAEALAALDSGDQIPPFSGRDASFDLERAYAVTAALRRLRTARGETHIGRKIGFTNRTIWAEYGVYAPIWGDMYDSTVHAVTHGAAFALGRMAEPRIEPEIAFKLKAAPAPGMDAAALLGTIEWVAHGFEIVTSIFPGWQFSAADVVAGGGVHGALLLGPAQTVDPRQVADLARALETFEITLERNDVAADRGQAANVLGGPLHALTHLVDLLAQDRLNPPLRAGEIVTTGTLTRALPIAAGERWTTALAGIALDGLAVKFE
jgi:2-oxo-3-hexenedioate decarboxylase